MHGHTHKHICQTRKVLVFIFNLSPQLYTSIFTFQARYNTSILAMTICKILNLGECSRRCHFLDNFVKLKRPLIYFFYESFEGEC